MMADVKPTFSFLQERLTAHEAMDHPYFAPIVKDQGRLIGSPTPQLGVPPPAIMTGIQE